MERVTRTHTEAYDRIEGLISRAQNGDKEAFTSLYQEYVTPVYRYTYLRVGQVDQAEDLTQEVFIRVLKNIRKYHYRGKPFLSWLFRIAHNLVIDHYRQSKKNGSIPISDSITTASEGDPAAIIEQSMEKAEVEKAIRKLPSKQREVISLRFGSELSIAETASAIGKTEGTVKKLQHEAIIKLRDLMKNEKES